MLLVTPAEANSLSASSSASSPPPPQFLRVSCSPEVNETVFGLWDGSEGPYGRVADINWRHASYFVPSLLSRHSLVVPQVNEITKKGAQNLELKVLLKWMAHFRPLFQPFGETDASWDLRRGCRKTKTRSCQMAWVDLPRLCGLSQTIKCEAK